MMKNEVIQTESVLELPSLPEVSDKSLAKKGKGWTWDPNLGSYVPDWEVVCTPDGNYWEYYDHGYLEQNHYNDQDYGGGGGNSSNSSSSNTDGSYQDGIAAVNELENDLNNGGVLAFEASKGEDGEVNVLTSVSLALTCKGASHSIIEALKADAGLIGKIGKVTGGLGAALSTTQFIIGVTDGEISAADLATGVCAALGIAAIVVSAPVLGTILGGASVVVGIASVFLPGDSGYSDGYN